MSSSRSISPIPDGYSQLPAGKIASVVTYLEINDIADWPMPAQIGDYSIQPFDPTNLAAYRHLFRRVGAPWLWFSRLQLTDKELRTVLGRSDVETYALCQDGAAEGLLEIDFGQLDEAELVYFGVTPEVIGGGAGKHLMQFALHRVGTRHQQHPLRRFWLHTCSLDHPRALAFYQQIGFRAYARAIEVFDDPRLLGLLPRSAAPHVPLIESGFKVEPG